jgi:hypothetical protein
LTLKPAVPISKSDRWYAGMRAAPIAMDVTVPEELSREGPRWAER